MIDELPEGALVVVDAGFTGYELMRQIVQSGRHFLIRVGGNVQLIRDLGEFERDGQIVYLWPDEARREGEAPLKLRLVKLGKMYLLTSVLDPERLNNKRAATLYAQRWGVELGYRALKQTLEKQKLHAGSPTAARMEIQGLLLGLTVLGLMSTAAIQAAGGEPLRWSVAEALRIVRRVGTGLWSVASLARAVKDDYVRRRKSRRKPSRKKQPDPPPGPPKQRPATDAEKQRYQALLNAATE